MNKFYLGFIASALPQGFEIQQANACAYLNHAVEDIGLALSPAGLELLEELEHLVNGEGLVGRVVVDPLEVGVGLVLHLARERALRVRKQ